MFHKETHEAGRFEWGSLNYTPAEPLGHHLMCVSCVVFGWMWRSAREKPAWAPSCPGGLQATLPRDEALVWAHRSFLKWGKSHVSG